jgi:murein DD-endopeptidase MepM/ murein hydrolase activator NlpD
MASGFGYRTDPFTKARKMHEGMDFAKNRHPNFMQLATYQRKLTIGLLVMGIISLLGTVMDTETLYGHLSKYMQSGPKVKRET